MEKENVSLVDQLAMLRITASSQIPAHEMYEPVLDFDG